MGGGEKDEDILENMVLNLGHKECVGFYIHGRGKRHSGERSPKGQRLGGIQ